MDVAAEVNLQSKFGKRGGLDASRPMGLLFIGCIDDLDVVRLVSGHHLISRYSIEDRVHNRPLDGRFFPASLGFLLREGDDLGGTDVDMEIASLNENTAPDNVSGFADPSERASTESEIHWRLTERTCALPAIDEMCGGSGTADEEDPDIFPVKFGPPAEIVERVFGVETEFSPKPVGDQSVESGTFVDFIEVG